MNHLGNLGLDHFCMQIIGWSMWFSDYVFLERSWSKDENTLKVSQYIYLTISLLFKLLSYFLYMYYLWCYLLQSGFKWLEDFPIPFWLALFVEGTRFTPEKLEVAQEFAASKGLPVPRNVLIPRTKVIFSSSIFQHHNFFLDSEGCLGWTSSWPKHFFIV